MPVPGQPAAYGSRFARLIGSQGTIAEIGADSQALRVTPYDVNGTELERAPDVGSFYLPVDIRQTAASASGSTVWCMTNGGTNQIHIRQIHLSLGFDGTAATASPRYQLCRGSGATPTTGTTITPIKRYPQGSNTTLADCRFLDTGLTTTGITFESAFAVIGRPISVTSHAQVFNMNFGEAGSPFAGFELGSGACFAIRVGGLGAVATVIGVSLTGYVLYDERPSA